MALDSRLCRSGEGAGCDISREVTDWQQILWFRCDALHCLIRLPSAQERAQGESGACIHLPATTMHRDCEYSILEQRSDRPFTPQIGDVQ